MICKSLLIASIAFSSLLSMENQKPDDLFESTLDFINTLIPQENPDNFNKKVKQYLKENNVTQEQKKELKSKLAALTQPTFYTIKTLADIKHIDCVTNPQKSTIAWIDTLDNTFNVNTTARPQEIIRTSGHNHVISCLSISSDQKHLITGSKGNDALRIWRLTSPIICLLSLPYFENLKKIKSNASNTEDSLCCIKFSPDKKHIICADTQGNVCVLKLNPKKKYTTPPVALKILISNNETPLKNIQFSLDNEQLIMKSRKTSITYLVKDWIQLSKMVWNSPDVYFPECIIPEELRHFIMPDYTEIHDVSPQREKTPSSCSLFLVDQSKPFKIATIYIPELLNFKKLYLHLAIRKAIRDENNEALVQLRKTNLIERYGTPELLRGYIDSAIH